MWTQINLIDKIYLEIPLSTRNFPELPLAFLSATSLKMLLEMPQDSFHVFHVIYHGYPCRIPSGDSSGFLQHSPGFFLEILPRFLNSDPRDSREPHKISSRGFFGIAPRCPRGIFFSGVPVAFCTIKCS